MDSQIYCLPQKLGWNGYDFKSSKGGIENTEKTNFRPNHQPTKPFFKLESYTAQTKSESVLQAIKDQYPKLGLPTEETGKLVLQHQYNTQYTHDFSPCHKPQLKAPAAYAGCADPVGRQGRRQADLPLDVLRATDASAAAKGRHHWRRLTVEPGAATWEPLERPAVLSNVGRSMALPPIRSLHHNPHHEKERWDYIKNLGRHDALSYRYRREMPGYTAYRQPVEHIESQVAKDPEGDSKAMLASTRAVHQDFPLNEYHKTPQHNKHMGPLSRMVTLTHPFNPFTQQTAYSTVGASTTE